MNARRFRNAAVVLCAAACLPATAARAQSSLSESGEREVLRLLSAAGEIRAGGDHGDRVVPASVEADLVADDQLPAWRIAQVANADARERGVAAQRAAENRRHRRRIEHHRE
jgi:hypothetical protein